MSSIRWKSVVIKSKYKFLEGIGPGNQPYYNIVEKEKVNPEGGFTKKEDILSLKGLIRWDDETEEGEQGEKG